MKEKLFFILAVSVLTITPALALVPEFVAPEDVEATFGPVIGTYTDISSSVIGFDAEFHIRVDAEVRQKLIEGAIVDTYIYSVWHDAESCDPDTGECMPENLTVLTFFTGLYDPTLGNGWISPMASSLTGDPAYGAFNLSFFLDFDANLKQNSKGSHTVIGPPLTLWLQAPGDGITPELFEFGYTGANGVFSGIGSTLAPGDPGEGASADGSPSAGFCTPDVNNIEGLRELVNTLSDPKTIKKLTRTLDQVEKKLDADRNQKQKARKKLATFIAKVIRHTHSAERTNLVCGSVNVINGIIDHGFREEDHGFLADSCSPDKDTILGLRGDVTGLTTSDKNRQKLTRILDKAHTQYAEGKIQKARKKLSIFIAKVIHLSDQRKSDPIDFDQANFLVCNTGNVIPTL